MSRLTIPLVLALFFSPGASCLAQCVDYGSYLHWAGSTVFPGLYPRSIAGTSARAFIADGENGLIVVDVSDPAFPVYVETLDTPGACSDVRIAGNYALVADGTNGLVTVDPGPPATIVNTLSAGYIRKLDVVNGVAACVGSKFLTINVSDPLAPVVLGTTRGFATCNDIRLSGTLALLACQDSLRIVDVTNSGQPFIVGSWDASGPNQYYSVDVFGSHAYLFEPNSGLDAGLIHILDVSSPAQPAKVGEVGTNYGYELHVSDGHLYVSGEIWSDLRIFALSNPVSPSLVRSMKFAGFAGPHVRVGNRILALGTGPGRLSLHVIELANEETAPVLASPAGFYGSSICFEGDRVYLGHGFFNCPRCPDSGELQILDVSIPSNPVGLGEMLVPSRINGLDVQGTQVLAAAGSGGLMIINVMNPASPQLLGTANTPGDARGVAATGDIAYVADGDSGVAVVDISNPALPSVIYQYATAHYASEVLVSGHVLFVADGEAGLLVLDVSDPGAPIPLGGLDTPGAARGLWLIGSTLFVADSGEGGLRIMDVSDPSSPALVGASDTPGGASRVTVAGCHALVADKFSGVAFIDISNPARPRPAGSHLGAYGEECVVVGGVVYTVSTGGLRLIGLPCPTVPVPPSLPPTGGLQLGSPWPNPTHDSATVLYRIGNPGELRASIADVRGARVRTLMEGVQPAGEGTLTWDGLDDRGIEVPAGVYFISVTTGAEFAKRRIIRLR